MIPYLEFVNQELGLCAKLGVELGIMVERPVKLSGATRLLCRVNEVTGEVTPRSRPVEDP